MMKFRARMRKSPRDQRQLRALRKKERNDGFFRAAHDRLVVVVKEVLSTTGHDGEIAEAGNERV